MSEHEHVTVERADDLTNKLEIVAFPSSWEKLTYAAGLGADIILSGEAASRREELALVAFNIVGFAAGRVLTGNGEALATETEEWTDQQAGAEMRLLASRVAPAGTQAIAVPAFIKRALVRWAVKKVIEFGEQYLGA
jgi:hypothetical protein